MKTVTLTQIEVTGIQEYIFSSNNLRQNVGASELVARATTEWVVETLYELNLKSNVTWNDATCSLDFDGCTIDSPDLQAYVIYAGGGNALILFDEGKTVHARPFTERLTRKCLEKARGLNLIVAHEEFDWQSKKHADALSARHRKVREQVSRRKLARSLDMPLPGLGITAACEFTSLPAVGRDANGRLISQTVQHKLEAYEHLAQPRLHIVLPIVRQEYDDFVTDFDLFGTKEESSYIAVIHTDGNAMSERFKMIAEKYPLSEHNAVFANELFDLSGAVVRQSTRALQATAKLLNDSRDADNMFGGEVPVPKKHSKKYFPFRPIVFGGDDTTFVCEGRLGLALAAYYLEQLAKERLIPRDVAWGEPLYARAGVAIVKSHYPFSRAYQLAEDLAKSAKDALTRLIPSKKGVILDWHFSTSGVVLPLAQVRAREYTSAQGNSMLMRPVRLNLGKGKALDGQWRSWENYQDVTKEFQENWSQRRNKVKSLRDALRQGPDAVKLFRANYRTKSDPVLLPDIQGLSEVARMEGWAGEDCGYFDTIEAMDFYVPLSNRKEQA